MIFSQASRAISEALSVLATRVSPRKKSASKQQWILIVYDGRGSDALVHSFGLKPSKSTASQYVGFYSLNAKPLVLQIIAQLKKRGLRGIARKIEQNILPPTPRFGQQPPAPRRASAQVIQTDTIKELRLANDALRLAREKRSQAKKRANADAYHRAESAPKRARGEE